MKRILFIAESGPVPAIDGKRQRTNALLSALIRNYQVDYLIINNKHDFEQAIVGYTDQSVTFHYVAASETNWTLLLKKFGILFYSHPDVKAYLTNLLLNPYSFVFTRYVRPVIEIPDRVNVVGDIDDDFIEVFTTRIQQEKSWIRKFRLRQMLFMNRIIYNSMISRLALAIFVKEETDHTNSLTLPNLPFQLLSQDRHPFEACTTRGILFIGKLSYRPNLEGILWFLVNVWPLLMTKIPEITLTIVSNVEEEDNGLQEILKNNSSITLLINQDDLLPVYHRHSVIIAPIFQGGGSSIKVAEALLMGRPVVTNSFGSRGFESAHERSFLFVEDDFAGFSDAIVSLLQRSSLIDLQSDIFDWAAGHFSVIEWQTKLLRGIEMANRKS